MPKVLKILKHHLTYTLTLTYLSQSSPASGYLFPPALSHCHSPEYLQPGICRSIPCYHMFLHLLWSSDLCETNRRWTFLPREFTVLLTVLLVRCSVNAQTVSTLSLCLISLLSLVDKSQTFHTSRSTYF